MEDYETVLLVKHEVFVYKIPPRTTNRAPRAADWNLQVPDWTGRMRLVAKSGKECIMKLEDKTSGELFAKCPIDKYPGIAVEAVADSSRYFVIRIQDDGGRAACIGMGFADRGDSFDLNVALQDHFKWVEKTEEIEKEDKEEKPQLDLSLKEGQTITINMKFGKEKSSTSRPKTKGTGTGFLPPPPGGGGGRLPPPPGSRGNSAGSTSAGATSTPPQQPSPVNNAPAPVSSSLPPQNSAPSSNLDLLVDLGGLGASGDQSGPGKSYSSELWGEFASAKPDANNVLPAATANNSTTASATATDWMNF